MSEKLPSSGWDIFAQVLCDENDLSIADARDRVILIWLENGDTRPFYDWVLLGHRPSREVVVTLAVMMAKADHPERLSPEVRAVALFGLSVTGRQRGRQPNMETAVRDHVIGRQVFILIKAGEKYDVAISAVHSWLVEIGINVGLQTVRDAYDSRVKKARAN
ncbi:hypothetical protein [Xanthobacter oligotrophicus]|uniref:hypothetical protein n=1 Tax=Xanthobacter oligotrophicus TaxID=2607286 RepID=UPI0011F3CF4C|nr:hypothetical protein [Xanthobacter oligotrophicus]MCG5237126.1 hypothetical protein [Xanthobacter oligotrophicus]